MSELAVIEYQNKRVLTTQQLAEVYRTDSKNIQMNFANNKDRFIEGRDYYYLQGEILRMFKNSLPNDIGVVAQHTPSLYLWTQRGANRHCKILDTDKAWEQFDVLEENYFQVKENNIDVAMLPPEMQMFKLLYDSVAKAQLEIIETKTIALQMQEKTAQVERTLTVVKDTIVQRDDDWRDSVNKMVNKIVKHTLGKNYQAVRSETYQILEVRAGCDLNTRLRNLRRRLQNDGATKSKINSITRMDVIESDKRLKEIYSAIVKELTIKYVA